MGHKEYVEVTNANVNLSRATGPPTSTLAAWKLQLAALLTSLAAFAGLIAVAITYNNHQLSEWSVSWLSINTVVAGLSTAMKGALMVPVADCISQAKWAWFSRDPSTQRGDGRPLRDLETIDKVSRGPWGSVLWLARYPNPKHLVTIGAVLTILANGLDVFSQQIISVDTRLDVDASQLARFPRVEIARNESFDEVSWLGAVYAGMYSADVPDLPATCPSGNCTWPPVMSVGVCGGCVDVTAHMPAGWVKCAPTTESTSDKRVHCNYSGTARPTPEREGVMSLTDAIPQDTVFAPCEAGRDTWEGRAPLSSVMTTAMGWGNSTYFANHGPVQEFRGQNRSFLESVAAFDVIHIPILSQSPEGRCNFTTGPASVTQCAVWFCLQEFDAKVERGNLNQTNKMGPPGHFAYMNTASGGAVVNDTVLFESSPGFNVQGREYAVHSPPYKGQETKQPEDWLLGKVFEETVLGAPSEVDRSPGNLGPGFPTLIRAWLKGSNDRDAWIERVAKSRKSPRLLTHA
jgi:hypothetical protein